MKAWQLKAYFRIDSQFNFHCYLLGKFYFCTLYSLLISYKLCLLRYKFNYYILNYSVDFTFNYHTVNSIVS